MNQIQLFTNVELGEIRTLLIDEQPWFVGRDIATVLGYSNPAKAVRTHVDEEDKGVNEMDTPGGKQKIIIINESGLYSLILHSKLPNAKKFKRWVTSEVLPEIRRTGGYINEGATPQQLEQLQQKIAKLLNYKIKGDTINDVCSATGLRRKDIKQYLFDNDWVVEYNGAIANYDCRYIFIVRQKDVHFTSQGLDKILRDLQPLKPIRPLINKELYRK